MSYRICLSGLALSLLVAQACGSDPGKRHQQGQVGGGGQGGEGGQTEPIVGGSEMNAGAPGGGAPEGGAGGVPLPPGGAGGTPEPVGGAGGEPPVVVPPDLEVLFSVKPNGVMGLDGSAVATHSQTNPQNNIYTSKTGSIDNLDGTNQVAITGDELGLDPTDQIVAFTALQPKPQSPAYAFSVSEGTMGAEPTRVYNEYQGDRSVPGDVYFSDAVKSYRYLGEGGDEFGYNGRLLSEVSLGLSSANHEGFDDLTGLLLHDANVPLKELYFTVGSGAIGATDSAVATTDATERGCTVFKSTLDGKNSVAYTCAALGLVANDEIDALLVYGATTPNDVVFSVTRNSAGAMGTGVQQALAAGPPGATLFESPGDTTNTILQTPADLGLNTIDTLDDIDGLAVMNAPEASVTYGATCDLSYDLFAAGQGAFTFVRGTRQLGNGVLVVFGATATVDRAIAFDASTCKELQQVDLPQNFYNAFKTGVVPLSAWNAKTPLNDVEYVQLQGDSMNGNQQLITFDKGGLLQKIYPVDGMLYTDLIRAVILEPNSSKLYVLADGNGGLPSLRLAVIPVPDAQTTTLMTSYVALSSPCNTIPSLTGVDPLGNLYVAQGQSSPGFRVCQYSPNGELLPLPYSWVPKSADIEGLGFIVGQGAHYLLATNHNAGPSSIERGDYQAPQAP